MKLLKVKATNFASYHELEFDLSSQGLALIYGATGSGKSTLQDVSIWILFGITAKDGKSDDIKSWTSKQTTIGELYLDNIKITRVRGTSHENDLYWEEDGVIYRGKDITETQVLLNNKLRIDSDLYILSAYYNEFSATSNFFRSKALERRELFEDLADLSLPTKLLERITDEKRREKKTVSEVSERLNKINGKLEQLRSQKTSSQRDADRWSKEQEKTIVSLQSKSEIFYKEKEAQEKSLSKKSEQFEDSRVKTIKKLKEDMSESLESFLLTNRCITCGTLPFKDEKALSNLEQAFKTAIDNEVQYENPHRIQLLALKKTNNHYIAQMDLERNKINPFTSQITTINHDISLNVNLENKLNAELESAKHRFASLHQLTEVNEQLRLELLKKTVKSIEVETNRYLETYFSSEIRVVFNLKEGDKLDTLIWKSGYECAFKQLSKGQRSLLKLAFSVSVMTAASNKVGINFNCLMFDESLDGLDTSLKLKAFGLFNELAKSHETVLVIDHNEDLQGLFDKKFHVTMNSDISSIKEV